MVGRERLLTLIKAFFHQESLIALIDKFAKIVLCVDKVILGVFQCKGNQRVHVGHEEL